MGKNVGRMVDRYTDRWHDGGLIGKKEGRLVGS